MSYNGISNSLCELESDAKKLEDEKLMKLIEDTFDGERKTISYWPQPFWRLYCRYTYTSQDRQKKVFSQAFGCHLLSVSEYLLILLRGRTKYAPYCYIFYWCYM